MTISAKKATWLSSLGAGLEYYDFIVYGMMVSYLNALFFAGGDSWMNTIKAFGVFAIGYVIRPLGGIFFGMIGDTLGRKDTFVAVMLLMAITTLAIGCLPTYATIGVTAVILLIILRLLQGLSFGAELPGAITVVNEYSQASKKSTFSSLVVSSVSIGSILASLILYALSKSVDQESIMRWGWRIPFLLGGLLALANYFIRKQLQETPEFLSTKRQSKLLKRPLLQLFRLHRRTLAAGLAMNVFIGSLIIFNLYLPTFLSAHYDYVLSDIYLAMTWGLVWSALSLPICGFLSDLWNRKNVFILTCVAFMLIAFPLFHLLAIGGIYLLYPNHLKNRIWA